MIKSLFVYPLWNFRENIGESQCSTTSSEFPVFRNGVSCFVLLRCQGQIVGITCGKFKFTFKSSSETTSQVLQELDDLLGF